MPALVLAGAGMMAQSCSKDHEDDPQPVPTNDIYLDWSVQPTGQGGTFFTYIDDIDNIKKQSNDPMTRYVYLNLLDKSDFSTYTESRHYTSVRNYLQKRIEVSPKVRGRGNFNNMNPGVIEKEDSLWFVRNGWTMKQR